MTVKAMISGTYGIKQLPDTVIFKMYFGVSSNLMDRPNQLQAGLVLCQGYIPGKRCANQTRSSHLKQCISWGLGD